MKCNNKILYNGNDGCISICKKCGHYQVAYLCMLQTFTEKKFQDFIHLVKYINEIAANNEIDENRKSVIIPTEVKGLNFLFTKHESKRLEQILDMAEAEAIALCMMEYFN